MRYFAPATLVDAVKLVFSEPDAIVVAGATDIAPRLRVGHISAQALIDIKNIEELCGVTYQPLTQPVQKKLPQSAASTVDTASPSDADTASTRGVFTVGAATPTARICEDAVFARMFPGLTEASGLIGSVQIQNRATWGGNLANASPAADTPPSLIVNDAEVLIAGFAQTDNTNSGFYMRTVPVTDVVTSPGQTSLNTSEIIVSFKISAPPPRTSDSYLRLIPRTEMDIAVVGAAARVTLNPDDTVREAKVALGAVAPVVVRAFEAEMGLAGKKVTDDTLAKVGLAASAACEPINDKRGTVQYRKQVAGVLAHRAVKIAATRAQESGHRNLGTRVKRDVAQVQISSEGGL